MINNHNIMSDAELEKFKAITQRSQELVNSNYTRGDLALQLAWLEINTCVASTSNTVNVSNQRVINSHWAHNLIQTLGRDMRNARHEKMFRLIHQIRTGVAEIQAQR